MTTTLRAAALLLAGALAAGCDSGRTDPPNASLRVVHAAASVGPVTFKRVKANATPLDYKSASAFSFDVDTYTFNFEILGVGGSVARTVSLEHTLEEGTDYTLVLRDIGGQAAAKIIESPARSETATGTQIELLHAAPALGAVDVFVEPVGFDLASATAWGSLSHDEALEPRTFTAGEYEIVLTEAGNRANVLLESDAFALGGTQNAFLFLADGAGESLAPIRVVITGAAAADLVDKNLQSGIRVLNAVGDRSAIDAGIDLELNPPLIEGLAFATVSDLALIPAGEHNLNVTPAGNPGVIETEETFTAAKAGLATWLVIGSPGALQATFLADDFRVIAGASKVRVFDGSAQNGGVEVFVAAPGADLSTVQPTAALEAGAASSNIRFAPGDYEITVRDSVDKTVLAGPLAVSITADGYYGILLSDALSGTGVDLHLLYDFN